MQAVILAAGEGKRLRPLTDSCPKPMICVGGKPILEYTLTILPEQIDEVILVVGYKQEKIRDYFGNDFHGRKLIYVEQPEAHGTGDALVRARPFLNGEPFLLLYADDMYHPSDLAALAASEHPAVLVKEHDQPERFGVCHVSDEGFLLELAEKPEKPKSTLVNVGPNLLHHDIFDFDIGAPILSNGESNVPAHFTALAKKRPVRVIRARFWHAVGYPEDLAEAERTIHLHPNERIN